jgi:23S rRNA (adenine-N6)-dimethyltransferase
VAGSRRQWGWHALRPAWAERLVADAGLPAGAWVLDIGAGLGALTAPLLDAGARVIAVEAHPGRAAELRRRFGTRVTVVRTDAGDLRLPTRPFHVVANPPYAATSAVLRRLLAPGSRLVSARLVVQAEAAARWASAAAPGAGRWQRRLVAELGPPVPRRAFVPPPSVRSQVLVLRHR